MWTLYIFSKHPKGFLNIGYSKDIKKAVELYKSFPTFKETNNLFYIEQHTDEQVVKDRVEQFMSAPRQDIITVIETQNPEWVELVIGVNILVA